MGLVVVLAVTTAATWKSPSNIELLPGLTPIPGRTENKYTWEFYEDIKFQVRDSSGYNLITADKIEYLPDYRTTYLYLNNDLIAILNTITYIGKYVPAVPVSVDAN